MYGSGEKSSSSPYGGCAVADYCRKYTVLHWRVKRRACSRPGCRPWSCGDRAGVLAAPAGGMVAPVEGTSPRRGVAALRGSCRSGY